MVPALSPGNIVNFFCNKYVHRSSSNTALVFIKLHQTYLLQLNSQIVQLTISVDRGAHDVASVGNAVKRKRKYRSFDLELCKLRYFSSGSGSQNSSSGKDILRKFRILKWKQKKENFPIYIRSFNVSSVVSCKM